MSTPMHAKKPAWSELYQTAKTLVDVLTRLSLALKAKNDAEGKRVYKEIPDAVNALRVVAYPMEQWLRENLNKGTVSDEKKAAGACLARVINGAQDALAALSGFGKQGPETLNQWYAALQEFVRQSDNLTKKELGSN